MYAQNSTHTARLDIADDRVEVPFGSVTTEMLRSCGPIRSFQWRRGQPNFPGWYWTATNGAHVVYESRLERARLILADFDAEVIAIRAQPLQLIGPDANGRMRRHVPDFALLLVDGAVRIVNVKPADRLTDPAVVALLEWAHGQFAALGWETEIWTGTEAVRFRNVQHLSAYRNPRLFEGLDLGALASRIPACCTLAEAEVALRSGDVSEPRSVLMHLLWTHRLVVDLDSAPLRPSAQVWAR